jgi:hypothetical protein
MFDLRSLGFPNIDATLTNVILREKQHPGDEARSLTNNLSPLRSEFRLRIHLALLSTETG